ncbi:hypothetical protein GGP41_005296 [Bipolaris sorokiniana]|uniref:Uncharacterized protein n=2 Tax=Cochliobolus sativus TaxID=45130 RepID=A0A8H6DVF1_COCSA|nr:hypothetical protein GGP41_005296 [Bipolaris sorokiniana]
MRLTTLLFVATTAMASRVYLIEDNDDANMLLDRAMDPADMNPTQLSILSVLKTAMPSGTSIPMLTGTSEPDWYKNLPDDVKSLLPQFYPATTTSSVESTSSSSSSSEVTSQASSTPTPTPTPTPTSNTVLTSSLVSEEASSAFVSAAAVTSSSVQVSSSSPSSTSTATTPLFSSTVSAFPSPSSNSSTTVTTTSASPTPSALFSSGFRNTMHTGLLAAVAYVSVALGFCLFV